jgi:hypothetical protein
MAGERHGNSIGTAWYMRISFKVAEGRADLPRYPAPRLYQYLRSGLFYGENFKWAPFTKWHAA